MQMTIKFTTRLPQNQIDKLSTAKESIDKIAACIGGIDEWMSSNRLKLNLDKIQFI